MIEKVKSLKEVGNMLEINAPHWLDATRQEGYDAGRIAGYDAGRIAGRDDGIVEGRNNREREIAMNLMNMGIGTEQISKATGLSYSDIENLKPNAKV